MHESVARDARDKVGIMDRLLEYDHKKINCLILLDGKKVETANSLQHVQNGKRKIDGVHTKLQCLKRFQSNLGTLTLYPTRGFRRALSPRRGPAIKFVLANGHRQVRHRTSMLCIAALLKQLHQRLPVAL